MSVVTPAGTWKSYDPSRCNRRFVPLALRPLRGARPWLRTDSAPGRARHQGPFCCAVYHPDLLDVTPRSPYSGATRQDVITWSSQESMFGVWNTAPVFVLEDLHWSDYAMLDLLAVVTQRCDPPASWCWGPLAS
jgi:hypothetical protein